MNQKSKTRKSKAGCVAARLTAEQQERVEAHAKAQGLSVSQWVGATILEALQTSPIEMRLMRFIAAESGVIRRTMEAWQGGKQLGDSAVQDRIEEQAAEMSARDAMQMARRLKVVEREAA